MEVRRGTEQEAAAYCKKDGDFVEVGQISRGAGTRTDVAEYYKKLKTGPTDMELMDYDFAKYSRFMKATDRYRSYLKPERTVDLKVHLLIGKPGTGKTRACYEKYPELWAFPIGKDLWSDGYAGQTTVLLDDFSGQMRLVDTLRLLDRYPIQIPKKGGFNWWCPERILITTNIHPKLWYDWQKRPDQEGALKRRIMFFWDYDNLIDHGDTEGPDTLEPDDYWVPGTVEPRRTFGGAQLTAKQLADIDACF